MHAWAELIDDDTAAYLLLDELGRNTVCITPIAALTADTDVTVVGTVQTVSEVKTFRRKNGTTGKVVKLEVSDGSGRCSVVLWNEDIELITSKNIGSGTKVRIVNGYTKAAYGTMELHVGKWGLLDVEGQEAAPVISQTPAASLEGTLVRREATKAFFRETGDFGFVTTIAVQTKAGDVFPVTLWDASVKAIQQYAISDYLRFTNLASKAANGSTELHCDGTGGIQKLSASGKGTRARR